MVVSVLVGAKEDKARRQVAPLGAEGQVIEMALGLTLQPQRVGHVYVRVAEQQLPRPVELVRRILDVFTGEWVVYGETGESGIAV